MLFKARELLVSELTVAWDCTDEYAEATPDEVLEPPRWLRLDRAFPSRHRRARSGRRGETETRTPPGRGPGGA